MKKSIMQFVPGLLLLVWLAISSVSGQAQTTNLLTNPGFETGNTTGWFAFGSPTLSVETSQVHSGTYAAQVTNRTATYMGIAQSFAGVLQSGQTYDVSAWVRLVNGGNQTMQLTMQKTDGSGTSYALIASGSVSSSGLDAAFRTIHVQSFGHSQQAEFLCGSDQQLERLVLY